MSVFKNGIKLSGSIIVATIIGFFLCISINVMCTAVFTENIGYNAYVYTKEGETPIEEYQYLYSEEETDNKRLEYQKQGYVVTTYEFRSVLEGTGKTVFLVVTQLINLIIVVCFASSSVYKQGFKEANLVRIGQIKTDYLKGFKIGIIANMLFFALFVMIVVFTSYYPDFRTALYAFLNSCFYPIILLIAGKAEVVSQLNVWQFVLMFAVQLIVPIVSGVAYILGLKEINFTDKLVYKKGEI